MFAWFQIAEPGTGFIGEILKLGTQGMLLFACIILWRANQSLVKSNETLLREMMTHADDLNKIPDALERLERVITDSMKR